MVRKNKTELEFDSLIKYKYTVYIKLDKAISFFKKLFKNETK